MKKVIVTEVFKLKDFDKLKNVVRFDVNNHEEGWLYTKDTFECDQEMFDYLNGNNPYKRSYIALVESDEVKDEVKGEMSKSIEEEPKAKKTATKSKKKKKK